MNRMTNRCKNITLPQTSFAGGNYKLGSYKTFLTREIKTKVDRVTELYWYEAENKDNNLAFRTTVGYS